MPFKGSKFLKNHCGNLKKMLYRYVGKFSCPITSFLLIQLVIQITCGMVDLEFFRMFIILLQIDVNAGTEHSIITKS